MARKYILDTNIYVEAIREPEQEDALGVFLERNTPMTFMSAVVMQELRAGAVTDARSRALQDEIFSAFERRNRIATPSSSAFKDCGRVLATLFRKDGVPYRDRPRSLVNDILIAITCREGGLTLITADGDFEMIQPYLRGFTYFPPWPESTRS